MLSYSDLRRCKAPSVFCPSLDPSGNEPSAGDAQAVIRQPVPDQRAPFLSAATRATVIQTRKLPAVEPPPGFDRRRPANPVAPTHRSSLSQLVRNLRPHPKAR